MRAQTTDSRTHPALPNSGLIWLLDRWLGAKPRTRGELKCLPLQPADPSQPSFSSFTCLAGKWEDRWTMSSPCDNLQNLKCLFPCSWRRGSAVLGPSSCQLLTSEQSKCLGFFSYECLCSVNFGGLDLLTCL